MREYLASFLVAGIRYDPCYTYETEMDVCYLLNILRFCCIGWVEQMSVLCNGNLISQHSRDCLLQ